MHTFRRYRLPKTSKPSADARTHLDAIYRLPTTSKPSADVHISTRYTAYRLYRSLRPTHTFRRYIPPTQNIETLERRTQLDDSQKYLAARVPTRSDSYTIFFSHVCHLTMGSTRASSPIAHTYAQDRRKHKKKNEGKLKKEICERTKSVRVTPFCTCFRLSIDLIHLAVVAPRIFLAIPIRCARQNKKSFWRGCIGKQAGAMAKSQNERIKRARHRTGESNTSRMFRSINNRTLQRSGFVFV